MDRHDRRAVPAAFVALTVWALSASPVSAVQDFDRNGYVNQRDFRFFEPCLSFSGPGGDPAYQECRDVFDGDGDGDIDLADFAAFSGRVGHVPIPLKDPLGQPILVGSTTPYSPRQTCGGCHAHDTDSIANGEWFQQGRTDTAGNVDMKDDYDGDGKYWIKSAGRYGKWGQSFQLMLAAKHNTHPSQIDETTFAWIRDCGGCHSGGGPGEHDRDGKLLWDVAAGKFGYELMGLSAEDVTLDGDYGVLDRTTGTVGPARWDLTGLSEPDCLLCHRGQRPTVEGVDKVMSWRREVLAAGTNLRDDQGQQVPAFAAAPTAGQGWFSTNTTGRVASSRQDVARNGVLTSADRAFLDDPTSSGGRTAATTTLQIDYGVGVKDGSLLVGEGNGVLLAPTSLARRTLDTACVSCHPLGVVAGEVWFDERDVHYRKFNRLNDADPNNDVPPERSTACGVCHPTGLDHNAAKGNSFQLQYRNDLDYKDFRTCRDCHLTVLPNGEPNPRKHPESPAVPGDVPIHQIGFAEGENGPMRAMSCQACHIPYALTPGLFFRDITVPGNIAWTSQYLSADPLDPTYGDKTRWYPPLLWKKDSDGVERLFPASVWINIYFGDWDQKGTPDELSDDVVAPIYTWRVAQVVGSSPLPEATDDDGDGRIEIDRPEEILAYFAALKLNDSNGEPVARRPVLVRGPRVWYEDAASETGVSFFEHEEKGIPVSSYPYLWGMDHNVLAKEEALGAGMEPESCETCHRNDGKSPVFDRKVLVDPNGLDGRPQYKTVREMAKVFPFHSRVVLRDSLGNPLTAQSTEPYSGRQTCGLTGCHDAERVSHGSWFQDGRTDVDGVIDMKDDYNNDGRHWIKSAGRYGKWGQSFQYQLAAKDNAGPSHIDQPTFNWVRDCSGCHPGGGPGELDRDGELLFDEVTGQFGYEVLGRTPAQVQLDGDYVKQDFATGTVSPAPWDVTGLSGPDCLFCHRADRPEVNGTYMSLAWRKNVLAAGENLVDDLGNPVAAFAAAGTAGQGWFSTNGVTASAASGAVDKSMADVTFLDAMFGDSKVKTGGTAATTTLQIDYSVGVGNGSLVADASSDVVSVAPASLTRPTDLACWGCHPYGTVAGTTWFDDRDIHYRKFNHLNDQNPYNDIGPEESRVCITCHPGNLDHNIAKGNSPQLQYRNALDWEGFRTCRDCHLKYLPSGELNPKKHPEAPDVGHSGDTTIVHAPDTRMFTVLSCQACHIPYALTGSVLFRDITVPGSVGTSQQYYSTDPLHPEVEDDDSRWYPAFHFKTDVDGVERLFPTNIWITFYFGDWDQGTAPGDLSDDVIAPIFTWRVAQVIGDEPLPILADDDGDGRKEINRADEILAYLNRLKTEDANGVVVADNPVLVRGKRVYYQDPADENNVLSFEHVGTPIAMNEWYPYLWGMDHNVLAKEESLGYAPIQTDGCNDCHRADTLDSPVFDRMILVDPLDETGQVVYEKVRDMTGLNPR